ncbi:TonB-dependent receptor [Novosphingobium lentum]|uniref:TonB-dependent receptor n=1 Tax=Novosphingobium lentum TaxID=145287 RepID=UPI000831BD42|nr:TonB-dependent receptor [Novosphingobium lentum]
MKSFSWAKRSVTPALLAGVAAVSLTAQTASAQTAPDQAAQAKDDGGIAEIVVTAQKRAENIQNVPISITAFTAASLETKGVTDVTAIGNLAPNVTLDAGTPFAGSSAVLSAYIRGIGQNDFAFNLDPGVGVYLDGVYLARSVGANQDLLDIDRVEILKGPQGTLFGRNTIGGAISINTKKPTSEFGAKFEVTGGRFHRIDTKGVINIPLATGLYSSFSFSTKNNDGYQKQIGFPGFASGVVADNFNYFGSGHPNSFGGENQYSMRGKLLWEATPDLSFTLSGDYLHQNNNGVASTVLKTFTNPADPSNVFGPLYNGCIAGALPPFATAGICNNIVNGTSLGGLVATSPTLFYGDQFIAPSKDTSYATGNNFSRLRNYGGSLTIDLSLGGAALKSVTAYRKLHWQSAEDEDGSPLPILQTSFDENQHQFSEELQLTGKAIENRLNYVFGLYYFNEGGNLHDLVTFPAGLLQIDGQNFLRTTNYAGYAHLNYKVTDQLSITIGGRYTHENKHFTGLQSDPNGIFYKLNGYYAPTTASQASLCTAGAAVPSLQGIPPGLFCYPNPNNIYQVYPVAPAGGFQQSFNNFSPKVGLEFQANPDLLMYASFSRGYKTGGWTTRLTTPQPAGTSAPTFGPEKATTYEGGIKSQFLNRKVVFNLAGFYTDYKGIQLNFQVGTSPTLQNAGNAHIYGFEAELQARPLPALTIAANLGYTHARYSSLSPFVTGVTLASSLPKTPEWKFTLSPEYTVDLGDHGSLLFSADYTHTSSLFNDTENTVLLLRPATDVLNASLTYKAPGDHWQLVGGATNITNARYLTTGQNQVAGGLAYGTYSRPAEWFVTGRVKF